MRSGNIDNHFRGFFFCILGLLLGDSDWQVIDAEGWQCVSLIVADGILAQEAVRLHYMFSG